MYFLLHSLSIKSFSYASIRFLHSSMSSKQTVVMILYDPFSFFHRYRSASARTHCDGQIQYTIRMARISRSRNLLSNVFRQVAKFLGVIASLRLTDITKLNMLRFRYGVTITSPTWGLDFDNSLWLIASRSNKTKLLSESRLSSSVMKCNQLSFKYVRFSRVGTNLKAFWLGAFVWIHWFLYPRRRVLMCHVQIFQMFP